MRDMTPNEVGSSLFKVKDELETILENLSKWRREGLTSTRSVPLAVIAAETKVSSLLNSVEEVIRLLATLQRK
jgi:hypothetical protein